MGLRRGGTAGASPRRAAAGARRTRRRGLALGPLPGHDRVLVALGAAHGFKFAPLLGRVLADLALHGGTEVDLSPFVEGRDHRWYRSRKHQACISRLVESSPLKSLSFNLPASYTVAGWQAE